MAQTFFKMQGAFFPTSRHVCHHKKSFMQIQIVTKKGIFVLIVDSIRRLCKSGCSYFRAFFKQPGLKQDLLPASPAEK